MHIYGNYLSNIFTLSLALISYLRVPYIISVSYLCVECMCLCVCVVVCVCVRTRIFFHFNCCFCFWYAKLCTVYYQWRANPLSLVRLYSFFWRNWNIIYRNLEENIIKCICPIVFARHEALERPDWISIKIAHTPRVHLCVRTIDNSIFSASVTAAAMAWTCVRMLHSIKRGKYSNIVSVFFLAKNCI